MAFVRKPWKVVMDWGDCEVIVQSKLAVHDDKDFEKDWKEVYAFLQSALELDKKNE